MLIKKFTGTKIETFMWFHKNEPQKVKSGSITGNILTTVFSKKYKQHAIVKDEIDKRVMQE